MITIGTSKLLSTTATLKEIVNDKHSQLNATTIKNKIIPVNGAQLVDVVRKAISNGDKISIAGGRHAMGGQQFLTDGILIDTSNFNSAISLDTTNGLVQVQSGMCWPALVDYLSSAQQDCERSWTIGQKQTGCDSLSIGGACSANIHGRGLRHAPFVADVEDFTIVTGSGDLLHCSRRHNRQLFQLAIGGYGLFGLIASATLRLKPLHKLRRTVALVDSADAVTILEKNAAQGATHGDYQFNINDKSADFLQRGILSTYYPVSDSISMPDQQKKLSTNDWRELTYLAHSDKQRAFEKYVNHYMATDGQLYWSDTFQLSTYIDDYHNEIDRRLTATCRGTELISELYVPRSRLAAFLEDAANLLRQNNANVIYGTVRLIEADTETFLPWAKQPWACIVFNLHVDHNQHGLAQAKKSFSELIDLAIQHSGSFYLTYHRYATQSQILACYPQLPEFLALKQAYDPSELFQSDWYNHICSQIYQPEAKNNLRL